MYIIWDELYDFITKQIPWLLVCNRIMTEWPPLVGEVSDQLLQIKGCRVVMIAHSLWPFISAFCNL
jgi:hypothetical protein